ncbi:MAG: hypothetical protein ACFE0J_25400 [Elainellaceae cyanobacterium]
MSNERVSRDTYDQHIVPSETAARKEREGQSYKHTPEKDETIDTTAGSTVDEEGLANNYAIEPEMYYEEPGDLRAKEQREEAERARELEEINTTNERGKLTEDEDERGKGTGVI